MKIQFDKVKHILGIVALACIPVTASMPYVWAKWAALGCGTVAFLCGALSDALFVKQIEATIPSEEKKS